MVGYGPFAGSMFPRLIFSIAAIFIYIASSSPNQSSIGATNGLAQTTVSIMRAFGPAAASSLFSLSIEKNYLGGFLVYFLIMVMAVVSIMVACMLP